jgi:hypothetical protein
MQQQELATNDTQANANLSEAIKMLLSVCGERFWVEILVTRDRNCQLAHDVGMRPLNQLEYAFDERSITVLDLIPSR